MVTPVVTRWIAGQLQEDAAGGLGVDELDLVAAGAAGGLVAQHPEAGLAQPGVVGPDVVAWNLMRIYGAARLPLLRRRQAGGADPRAPGRASTRMRSLAVAAGRPVTTLVT